MKFFKHYTGASHGTLKELIEEFGFDAYGRYWKLVEMCVAKLDKDPIESFTEAHMNFTFTERTLQQELKLRSTNLQLLLDYCSTSNLFRATKDGNKFNIYFPKILESLDRDAKRARKKRDDSAPNLRLETEREKEEERETEEETEKASAGRSDFEAEGQRDLDAPGNLIRFWNSQGWPLQPVIELTQQRLINIQDRLREAPLEAWFDVIREIHKFPFLLGQNERGWKASFDWLISDQSSRVKILEGHYKPKPGQKPPQPDPEILAAKSRERAERDAQRAAKESQRDQQVSDSRNPENLKKILEDKKSVAELLPKKASWQ